MKETINFSAQPQLERFSTIVSENFSLSLMAITSKNVSVTLGETYKTELTDLVNGYEGKTHIFGKEENISAEIGVLISVQDVTALADLMLAGEGQGQDELDSEILDAVKELSSQLLSGLNVPFEGAFGSKFSIKVADVDICSATANFEANEYIVFDYTISFDDKNMPLRLYIDETMEGYLAGGVSEQAQPDAQPTQSFDFFSTPAPVAPNGGQYTTDIPTQNLDLLLDIDIPISVRMGTTNLFLKDILGLGPGNIVELEQNAGEPIELAVNDKVVARGEVVIIDGYFGFRIREIVSKAERLKKLKD